MKKQYLLNLSVGLFLVAGIFILKPNLALSYEAYVGLIPPAEFSAPVINSTPKITAQALVAKEERVLELGALSVLVPAQAITEPAVLQLSNLGTKFSWPWNYELIGEVYQFDFAASSMAYNSQIPLNITLDYGVSNNYYKQIFFFDGSRQQWRPLPSVDNPSNHTISAKINFPYARVAVLFNNQVLTVGQASWYRFKGGLFAASPDFKAGTILKVTNLDNNKSVNVTVNDYGPDRKLFPTRVIDLDYVAFSKIASVGAGIVNVKIETEKLIDSDDQKKISPAGAEASVSARSAIVFSESDGQILYNKNASSTAPLASLTKLIAAQVFLDTKPNLDRVVSYSVQDEEYNYEYCKPWESSRLRVSEGETLTIEDLLYSALVGSANNAVESLVRVSGLSRVDFIKKMNEQAKTWGAFSTNFVEPTGLSPENVSSPLDYAIMTKELFKNPLLQKISTTQRYSFTTVNKQIKHNLTNTNSLLFSGDYQISGSKTGYLDEAGYCLMTRVDTPLGKLIIVNFGAPTKADNFKDNALLINYGLKQLAK